MKEEQKNDMDSLISSVEAESTTIVIKMLNKFDGLISDREVSGADLVDYLSDQISKSEALKEFYSLQIQDPTKEYEDREIELCTL